MSLAADRVLVRRARVAGRVRGFVVGLVLTAVGVVVFCWSLAIGDFPIPLGEIVPAIVGLGSPDSTFIVQELRLPRALVSVLVGVAFGFSGAIFQSLARNPLASPDIIGITAGASTAAVVVIVVFDRGGPILSVSAFVGALLTAVAIYFLAYKRGVSSYRLILVGIGAGALLSSVTAYLLTTARINEVQRAVVWLTGSVNGRGWEHVGPLTLTLVVLIPSALVLTRQLRALQLNDDTATGLGLPVERSRAALIVVAVGLAAVATAVAGPVAFVAFIAPPIARRLVDGPLSMIPAALVGGLLMLVADLAGREVFGRYELPVGIVTGIIGAPYLLFLLARANRVGRGG